MKPRVRFAPSPTGFLHIGGARTALRDGEHSLAEEALERRCVVGRANGDALPRVFDRFFRVDAARADPSGHHGHGLGLAIVRAVADMHGGEVFAASAGGLTTIGFSVASTP